MAAFPFPLWATRFLLSVPLVESDQEAPLCWFMFGVPIHLSLARARTPMSSLLLLSLPLFTVLSISPQLHSVLMQYA